ncbi:hypothetical protein AAH446_15585 [Erwinia sp. P6884]
MIDEKKIRAMAAEPAKGIKTEADLILDKFHNPHINVVIAIFTR